MENIALVTGAGSGIGRAVSIGLAENGWTVVLAGRRKDALLETVNLSLKESTRVMTCDVTDPGSVAVLFKQIKEEWGRLDLLFNNAGISAPDTPLDEIEVDTWKQLIDVNVTGAFLCAQQAFKLMKEQNPQGGRIINNGSISAHVPRPQATSYSVSKHAITGLTKSTSLEGRVFNIACGQINIGNAKTDMTEKMGKGVLQADGEKKVESTMPVKSVTDAVLYMSNLPLETNVPFITVMANKMPYVGRG